MTYSYKFVPVMNPNTPKQDFTDDVQANIDERFYEATDVYTIEEETALASGIYKEVDVRVHNVINAGAGANIEVDYKKITFKNINHPVDMGKMYRFDNNYWVSINVDKIKSLVQTVLVKRCNNVLRWMDLQGVLHAVPCSIGYAIMYNRDYSTAGSALVTPSGVVETTMQLNADSNTIRPNQRFLLGNSANWVAYRLEGGGINNFNNQETFVNNPQGILKLTLATDYVNLDTDDTVNGLANTKDNIYAVTMNQTAISGSVGQSVQIEAVVTLNGNTVSRPVVWSTSNSAYATVSSTGLVTFVATGTAIITCTLFGNALVYDTCTAQTVGSAVDNYQLIISPISNTILEGATQNWTAYLYKNGVVQADVVTFSLTPNSVPSVNYFYNVTGDNSFSIMNIKRFLSDTLKVTATSGAYSDVINISLRGAW
jgi:hypothetical protein